MRKTTSRKNSKKVERPWGGYEIIEKGDSHWIKKLFVKKGEQTSLQAHKDRDEIWIVLKGSVRASGDSKLQNLRKGDIFKVKKKEKHRLHGIDNAVVLEVAFGKPREGDIVRYKDDYGRA